MNSREVVQKKISDVVKTLYSVEHLDVSVEKPKDPVFGDVSSNVALTLSKQLRHPPMEIAKNVCYELRNQNWNIEVEGDTVNFLASVEFVSPGFINFRFSPEWLHHLLWQVLKNPDNYGSLDRGKGEIVLVEFSQPNPNKPMHIGHARNNFLGYSLSRILSYCGYSVIKANYMNDWGTHICKPMLMYKKYYDNKSPDIKSDHFVGNLYARYEAEVVSHPELKEELAQMFQKLEAGDKSTLELWEKITSWAYEGQRSTYKDQGIQFDVWFYQHDYKDSGKEIVEMAYNRGIAFKDESGAVIANLEAYGIPNKVLLRSDGTSIYSTQDLQLALDSFEKYKLSKRYYVVDYRQSDYFKQLFKIIEILGFPWADKLGHISYGTVDLPEGSMSSRSHRVIQSDDVFEQLVGIEKVEIDNSAKRVTRMEQTARAVAMAAFKYALLKVDPQQNIVFRSDLVTRFEGNTGPYLLYSYTRAHSVLEKAAYTRPSRIRGFFSDYFPGIEELALQKGILEFEDMLLNSLEKLSPAPLANYCFDLCSLFNSFYAKYPVLDSEGSRREYRLVLCYAFEVILKKALFLLGIEPVVKM